LIYELLILAIVIGYIKKGSLKNISTTKLAKPYLFFISFGIQILVMFTHEKFELINQYFDWLIFITYLFLIYGCWVNRHLPGFILFGFGMLLNCLVITLNDGRMPVSQTALEFAGLGDYISSVDEGMSKHQLMSSATYLAFLGDIIPLKPPYAMNQIIVSIGDVIMTLGIAKFLIKQMRVSS
jgi:hypothetical protein